MFANRLLKILYVYYAHNVYFIKQRPKFGKF